MRVSGGWKGRGPVSVAWRTCRRAKQALIRASRLTAPVRVSGKRHTGIGLVGEGTRRRDWAL